MNPSARPGYKWELLALFWLANFLNQGDRQIFNAILPRIQSGIGASDVEMGLVAGIFTLCFGVLVPVAGWLGDRVSRKRMVCASLLVFSAGTLLTGLSGGLIALIIFRSVATGAGESFYTPPALSLISQHHERTRSLAMSINQTSQYVGVVASSWIAAWLAEHYGWRTAFYAFGGLGVLLAAVLMLRLHADAPPEKTAAKESGSWSALLRNPSAWLLTLAFACMVFATTGFMTWMPTLLYTKFELSLSTAAFQAVFVHYLFAFAGVLLGGWWSDRRGATRTAVRLHVGAFGLLAAAPFIFLLGYAETLPVVYVALAVFGFFRGVYDANIFAALYEVVPVRSRATATGLMICFAYVTGATAPLLLGYIKQTAGLDHGLAWLAPAYVLGGVLIVIAAVRFFHRDRAAALSSS
jgi:MFS family permease